MITLKPEDKEASDGGKGAETNGGVLSCGKWTLVHLKVTLVEFGVDCVDHADNNNLDDAKGQQSYKNNEVLVVSLANTGS